MELKETLDLLDPRLVFPSLSYTQISLLTDLTDVVVSQGEPGVPGESGIAGVMVSDSGLDLKSVVH